MDKWKWFLMERTNHPLSLTNEYRSLKTFSTRREASSVRELMMSMNATRCLEVWSEGVYLEWADENRGLEFFGEGLYGH